MTLIRVRGWLLVPILLFVAGCSRDRETGPPRFLAITHAALNRLTFFDPDTRTVVGALPTQKLPHDMLVSGDRSRLYVVGSGSQSISVYALDNPELWKAAAAFLVSDSTRKQRGGKQTAEMFEEEHTDTLRDSGSTYLNRDPVQRLPAGVVRHVLTSARFPDGPAERHRSVGAMSHTSCFDCHDRSVGGKPFGPMFLPGEKELVLVHLAYRTITFLDARTLACTREIPLPLDTHYAPVEIWVDSSQTVAFVTCRNEIGERRPGLILVIDLRTGELLTSITTGIYPWHMVPDRTGRHLFVNYFQSSRIGVVDIGTRTIVDSLIVQNGPADMKVLPGTDILLVTCFYTDTLLWVNTRSGVVEHAVGVDTNPTSVETSPDGRHLYVLCGGESSLVVVDAPSFAVQERYPLLFGAYAFRFVDRTH